MKLPEEDLSFLTGLVKMSRQRINYVHWVDRDGCNRQTALTAPELARVNALAAELGVAKGELLRQAAHIPVPKLPPRPAGTSPKPVED